MWLLTTKEKQVIFYLQTKMVINNQERNKDMFKDNSSNKYDLKVVEEISLKLTTSIKRNVHSDLMLKYVLVYLGYIALDNKIDDNDQLNSFIDNNLSKSRSQFIKEIVQENIDVVFELIKLFKKNDLLAYLHEFPTDDTNRSKIEYITPKSLSKLANRILNIYKNDDVADFGSGYGNFLTLAAEQNEYAHFYGIDLDAFPYEISKIRSELFANNIEYKLGNIFDVPLNKKFDKIFSNYPFGMRLIHLMDGADYVENLSKRMPELKRITSSDWIFNSLIVDHLKDTGKAIAIMTNGSTLNSFDKNVREYFIKKGLIEAVIALPSKLFETTMIPTSMVVFSKGNESVRMIDASNICMQGRRQNTISDENIDHIMNLLKNDAEEAVSVALNTIKNNEYVLNPSRYLNETVTFENGVEFGSLIKRITRGASISARVLDEMVSEAPTDVQYLMLSNIQNGMISEELPYLKSIDSKLNKYCIGNRNLLLSKNGKPFKIAVAEIGEGKTVLGSGNLYIIELDEEKVNPYFIKAFFDSEVGTSVLNSIAVGARIPNISTGSLKKLIIPLPSMKKQNKIANMYKVKQDEIKNLELKIKKAQVDLQCIYEEVE